VTFGVVVGTLVVAPAACSNSPVEPVVLGVEPPRPLPPLEEFPPSLAGAAFDRVTPSHTKDTIRARNSVFTFEFDAGKVPGWWLAKGTLRGDTLIVSYNEVMLWSDFEDGE
jgi:hypothetical protein